MIAFVISFSVISVADDNTSSKGRSKEMTGKVPQADSVKFEAFDKGWVVHGFSKGKRVYTVRRLEKGAKVYKVTNDGQIPIDVQDTLIIQTFKHKE